MANEVLLRWLKRLPAEALARVIANRPEAVRSPWPRHLLALAQALGQPDATTATIRRLATPPIQVLHALAVLPPDATCYELARFLGVDETDADLESALTVLAEHALVWEEPDGRLQQAPGVEEGWQFPLDLGRSIRSLLDDAESHHIKDIARRLGMSVGGSRQSVVERLVAFYDDADNVVELIDSAPEPVGAVLAGFSFESPVRSGYGVGTHYRPNDPMTPDRWAAERGLLWPRDWAYAEMPREVALSMRGPEYTAPFTPRPPELKAASEDPDAVDAEASAAAGHLLDRAGALLDLTAKTPIAVVKAGGVGAREITRLTKALRCTAEEIRVLLEVTFSAKLLDHAAGGLVPTASHAGWRVQPAPDRLRRLLVGWWSTPRAALRRVRDGLPPVLAESDDDGQAPLVVRRAALAVLADLAPGDSTTDLIESVAWRCPLYSQDVVEWCLPSALAEAQLLGLVARDAASALGRALAGAGNALGVSGDARGDSGDARGVSGDARGGSADALGGTDELLAAATRMLAVTRQTALFGADLTAVVTGPPASELSAMLDRVADRETRGAASVWRFSPATVRRAMDEGMTDAQLLADLNAVAQAGLPQTLEYLIKDVARRHGEVSVTEVSCVIRGSDEALLAEIAAHRKLAKFGLRVLAPTVLGSAVPLDATLAALRDAGYAPVVADADGIPVIGRAKQPPEGSKRSGEERWPEKWSAKLPAASQSPSGSQVEPERSATQAVAVSPEVLAERLLGTPVPILASGRQIEALIAEHSIELDVEGRFLLQYLVRYGAPTQLNVRSLDGSTRWRTLERGELDGPVLHAWCSAEATYVQVPLSSIIQARNRSA
jgi:hypothetical protein